ncbi:MAG: DUF1684 domain-containing protein, partial [Chloroflexota bacterium]|nr:DUF1684 domain-containing protein [Dehalococcoidia bacterium]MDW8255388.1 DUF1684 domain-containing protein [Chloroflexota bacterium]
DARGEPAGHAELEGGLRLAVIRRGERHALRVWDPEAPTRRHFAGLEHYPPSLRWWLVRARFEPHDPVRELEVPDVTGGLQRLRNPGRLRFEIDGRGFTLEAFQEAPGERLFLVFADRTNGRETYGGGRFLYADPPDAEGTVRLDFNRAFNPPCAFTAFATCPLPPPENRLDLAIEAGEKRYRPREEALSGP